MSVPLDLIVRSALIKLAATIWVGVIRLVRELFTTRKNTPPRHRPRPPSAGVREPRRPPPYSGAGVLQLAPPGD